MGSGSIFFKTGLLKLKLLTYKCGVDKPEQLHHLKQISNFIALLELVCV